MLKIDSNVIKEYTQQISILFVKDDTFLRTTTEKIFNDYFSHIDVAHNGKEGLIKFKEYKNETGRFYDIVISDIEMPIMDGISMSEKILFRNPIQSIIFLSGTINVEHLHNAVNLGIKGFLKKPIDIDKFNETIHKISQLVTDQKITKEHYQRVEVSAKKALMHKDKKVAYTLLDIIGTIERNTEDISRLWLRYDEVAQELKKFDIKSEFFRNMYAIKVILYFLDVAKEKHQAGNCPVIHEMLNFFHDKSLSLESVFVICIHFKNIMTSFVFENYRFDQEIFDEMSLILDQNFKGIIQYYDHTNEPKKYIEEKKIEIETPPTKDQNKQTQQQLIDVRHSVEEKISASEYLQTLDHTVIDKVDSFLDTLDGLTFILDTFYDRNEDAYELLPDIVAIIKECVSIIDSLGDFSIVIRSFHSLGLFLSSLTQEMLVDTSKKNYLCSVIIDVVRDLETWIKIIFVDKNVDNIHYLDASFASNILEIESIYINNGISSDDDLEFF
jgi:YesN/AraC family two-component response regulator